MGVDNTTLDLHIVDVNAVLCRIIILELAIVDPITNANVDLIL